MLLATVTWIGGILLGAFLTSWVLGALLRFHVSRSSTHVRISQRYEASLKARGLKKANAAAGKQVALSWLWPGYPKAQSTQYVGFVAFLIGASYSVSVNPIETVELVMMSFVEQVLPSVLQCWRRRGACAVVCRQCAARVLSIGARGRIHWGLGRVAGPNSRHRQGLITFIAVELVFTARTMSLNAMIFQIEFEFQIYHLYHFSMNDLCVYSGSVRDDCGRVAS